jgi:hypothetical protein
VGTGSEDVKDVTDLHMGVVAPEESRRGPSPVFSLPVPLSTPQRQRRVRYRTLMGAQQPAFQQRDHPVNTWQKMLACGLLALNKPFVLITLHLAISIEAISNNRAAGFYTLSNEPIKGRISGIPAFPCFASKTRNPCISDM